MRCPSARGRWRCAFRFPNEFPLASHPRARLVRALLLPKVALACAIGRGSRSKVCSSCRRCVLRASNGFPARSGATRSAKPPKTERGAFRLSKLAEKLPRSVSRLAAGVAPYPMREGQHRARPTGEPARVSPRAAYAYGFGYFRASRSNHSPLRGTLTGHDHRRQQDAGRRVAV